MPPGSPPSAKICPRFWAWLDGPREPEGRAPEPARHLARNMNGDSERHSLLEGSEVSGLHTWSRLEEIPVPALVPCEHRDMPILLNRSRELASRLPQDSHVILPETAHPPHLEQPDGISEGGGF